jgi:hypothetical protein
MKNIFPLFLQAAAASEASGGAPKKKYQIYNPDAGFLNAEARRTLDSPSYGTAPNTVKMPTDTVVKRLVIKGSINTTVTYGSGSPAFGHQGFLDRIVPRVEVNIGGGRVIKSVRPHLARLHSAMLNGNLPRRAYNFKSTAQTSTRASREWLAGVLAYPATTYYCQLQEVMELNFQNVLGYGGSRYLTELDIRDVSSANLTFYFAPMTNLQEDGVGASVTYATAPTVNIVPMIVENRARPRPEPGQTQYDYVETSFTDPVSGAQNGRKIDVLSGNFLMAMGIYVNNGDTNLTPAENLLTKLALKINGSTSIQGAVDHQDLQDDNIMRYGCRDDLGVADWNSTIASTADVHPLQGFAFMNLLRNGDWNTALNLSQASGISSAKLEYNAPASTGTDAATYTAPMVVTVHTHELRPFVTTK